jgi:DNA-binding IclR family transcriptional regulator
MADTEPSDLIRSVSRALRVLEQVTRAERPLTVKMIARRCDLNLSTAYHLVRTLCYEGYLRRRPNGEYVIGPQVAERFHELIGSFQRPPRASAVLHHLAAATGHTAYLARLSHGRLFILDVAEGPESPWLEDLQAGLETAPHATALGKALLVTLPRHTRRGILAEYGMRPFTSTTPTSQDDLEAELSGLRPGELVEEHGQFRSSVSCAGVAVPDAGRDSCVALGISARGLDLPSLATSCLRRAAADLRDGMPASG